MNAGAPTARGVELEQDSPEVQDFASTGAQIRRREPSKSAASADIPAAQSRLTAQTRMFMIPSGYLIT
jgi:hypothetical protein